MSWLFDRLTDLAVADHLTVVIDVPTDDELSVMLQRTRSLAATSVGPSTAVRQHDGAEVSRSVGTFVASASPSGRTLFEALGEHDLGVAVGGAAPGASLQVDTVGDLCSLLDALVTLRSYAQRAVA